MKRIALFLAVVVLVSMPLMAQEAEKSEEAGKIYTVKKGDTLWDISGVFLKDPFKWPAIWEKNPKVKDPHWIYPGDVLIILPSGEIRKKVAEEAASVPAPEEKKEEVKEPPKMEAPAVAQPKAEEEVPAAAPVAEEFLPVVVPVQTKQTLRYPGIERVGFIASDGEIPLGKIVDAKEDKLMLSSGDDIYIDTGEEKGVKKGDKFTIYRIAAPVYHPVSKKLVGHQVDILGTLEVTAPHDKVSEGQILESYDAISRGDSLKMVEPVPAEIEIKKGEVPLDGLIIANKKGTVEIAEGDIVFLDKGKRAGVEAGNTLMVYLSGKIKDKLKMPSEDVGRLLVLSTQEDTAMALVIGTKKPFRIGDKVRMEN
ncbi:MAG: Peptidoglycan-binding LysM [Deltaproteobacteria bacterium]|nr:Peptidoglycan-binding LysM [Deltaproteobacteria bacterium]